VGNNLHGLKHGTDEQPPLPAHNIRARGGNKRDLEIDYIWIQDTRVTEWKLFIKK
jgi:hypothetical protein